MVEYGYKIEEKLKTMKSEIKENVTVWSRRKK